MKSTKWKALVLALGQLAAIVCLTLFLGNLFLPICRESDGSLNTFLMAVLVGIPFGIRHMVIVLPPASYDISSSLGVIALDFIVGGLIGFGALCILLIKRVAAVFAAIIG